MVLEQTTATAIVFARKDEDWVSGVAAGSDAVLRMPEIGVEIPLGELYEGVDLSASATPETTPA